MAVARKITSRIVVDAGGFSLIDMLVVTTFIAILMGMAVPAMQNIGDSIRLGTGAREVERELQTARLKAVTTNRVLRVRFNCPTAGHYRMVELIGTPGAPAAADDPMNRCSQVTYPFPPDDQNPMTLPNHDGPARQLHPDLSFGASKTLEFWPDGTVHADSGTGNPWQVLSGTGTAITVVKGADLKTITVNSLGKITLQ